MSMKKVVILAAAALTLAACAKTYELQETAQPKIGFDTWANNLTKRVQGSNEFVTNDDFAVYGYKYKSSGENQTVTVFDDVVVKKESTSWTYSPLRYWDANYEQYTFFAVSPASVGTDGTVNPQTGEINSTAITFAGNDNDILVADKQVVAKGAGPMFFNSFGTVDLQFNHVASLVDIKVKKAPAFHGANISITALALNNIEKEGVLSVSDAYTGTHPVVSWSSVSKGTYGPANGVNPVTIGSGIEIDEDTTFDPENPTTPAAATDIITNLVVKPQTFETTGTDRQMISITYKIGTEDAVTKELYLSDFDTINDADQNDEKVQKWEPGKHYTFYITIGANAISFSADITDWTNVSGYNYLIN